MGVAIPGVTGLLHQPTGQVIDGSLKFDSANKNRIDRTATSGSGTTWTLSLWVKKQNNDCHVFGAGAGNIPGRFGFTFDSDDKVSVLVVDSNSTVYLQNSAARFRDIGWYHFVLVADTTNSTAADRFQLYVNGVRQAFSGGDMPDSQDTFVNSAATHTFGRRSYTDSDHFSGQITNAYLIDGQALGPEYFGFTDPLTNTWRPKKYTGGFSYTLTAPTYDSGGGSDVTTSEFDKMVDGDLSTYGQGTGASGTNRFIGFSLAATEYPRINIKIKNTTGGALDFYIQPDTGSGYDNAGTFASSGSNAVNVAGGVTHEDTFTFPSNYSGTGRIYLNNSGNAADAWEIYDFGGTKVTTNSFHLPFDGNSPIGQDKSGNGNNWTPVNFGGSVALDNPQVSGARPILDTTQGGTQAAPGVFGSKENKYYTVTTANGSVYQFDITSGDNPSLSFIRGATYKFDYSSFTGHPVLFSSTNPDSSTTAYTDGTSIASNVISFTVPHDAPDTLYYYCQNHPTSMNGSISVTTDETKADPYAWKNVLALPLVGSANDVSASIACTSTTKALTTNGNAAAASESSNFYSGSFEFDGTDDDVRYTSPGAIGTGDFTLECWVNFDVLNANQGVVDTRSDSNTNGFALLGRSDGTVSMADGTSLIGDAISASAGRWIHLAGSRSGSSLKFFVDGKLSSTVTNSTNFSNDRLIVGTIGGGTEDLNGYVQDVRLYLGVAKYTSDFVVPATSPDILPDTPSGVSGSSKLTKITDGAVSFDGTGDYLSLAASSDFDFGTGNFTMEGFFYKNSTTTLQTLLCSENYNISGNNGNWILRITSGTQIAFATYDGTSNGEYSEFTAPNGIGGWHHFALVREGTGTNQTKFYYDGKLAGSMTVSKSLTDAGTNGLRIGEESDSGPGNNFMDGFLSNIRIIKGTALYTSDFTPPTSPLTNVTNTKLLCCQSNTSATAAAVTPGSITANGDVAPTNFNPFNTDINTVRGQETGYCTLNPLDALSQTLSDGNLTSSGDGTTSTCAVTGTISVSSGKYYYEMTAGSGVDIAGIWTVPRITDFPGSSSDSYGYFGDGQSLNNGSGYTYASAFTIGDTIGVALDLDNGTLRFYKNGIDQGIAFSNISGEYRPAIRAGRSGTTSSVSVNFGQKPFKFPPPDGFQPLNAANVRPETVIARPDQYVGVTTYTGSSGNVVVKDLNFKPDAVWMKQRNASAFTDDHVLVDSVRGRAKSLYPSGGYSENTSDADKDLISFDINGFTLGPTQQSAVNRGSSYNYVAWCWKAGGNKNTFNVDDVGYANASDVNMNVGALNSSVYDQSQTWSTNATLGTGNIYSDGGGVDHVPSRIFDGDSSTSCIPEKGTASSEVSLDLTSTITGVTKIRVQTSAVDNFSINGGSNIASTGNGYQTIYDGSAITLTSLKFIRTSGVSGGQSDTGFSVTSVEINGKQLIDSGATPPNVPSIAPTGCSVGTKQGFSIVAYEGTSVNSTIPHGLTKKPQFILAKNRDSNFYFTVYHAGMGYTKYADIEGSLGYFQTNGAYWTAEPTSSVFSIGIANALNANQDSIIAYLWHDVPGLQKFGIYEGNASTDGSYVELGFKPAILMLKNADAAEHWYVYDSERSSYNAAYQRLLWSSDAVEETSNANARVDLLSSGFKLRQTNAPNTANTYIYAAWAEAPTIDLYGGQSNAR